MRFNIHPHPGLRGLISLATENATMMGRKGGNGQKWFPTVFATMVYEIFPSDKR
jgi:hypothetical protein